MVRRVFDIGPLLRQWRYLGLLAGIMLGSLTVALLSVPERSSLVAKGPMNTGHEGLACSECHSPAKGTTAQQVSANVYHWLGLRQSTTGFGSQDVTSEDCLACHTRPEDRHPISRFLEPRFAEARRHLKVYDCIACHTEHQGKRVTLTTIGYCTHCHQDAELEDDPISPTHVELVRAEAWNTCLQCHDFHGNHEMNTPTRIEDGVSEEQLWGYFHGAPDPYSIDKAVEALKTRGDRQP